MAQTTMINSKKMSESVSHVCIRATDSIGVKENSGFLSVFYLSICATADSMGTSIRVFQNLSQKCPVSRRRFFCFNGQEST
jgi:hypothetical protein